MPKTMPAIGPINIEKTETATYPDSAPASKFWTVIILTFFLFAALAHDSSNHVTVLAITVTTVTVTLDMVIPSMMKSNVVF